MTKVPPSVPMTGDHSSEPLKDLDQRLKKARAQTGMDEGQGSATKEPASGAGLAFRIGTDLVSGVLLGAVIGIFLDRWLETAPWFLIGFFFLGSAAGMLSVYRTVNGLGMAAGYQKAEDTRSKEREKAAAGGKTSRE